MPVWSGSSQLPGSPLVVRFTKSATAGLRDFLSQRFDNTVVPVSGSTTFMVITNPGYNYSASSVNANGFGVNMLLYSGDTTTGGFIPTPSSFPAAYSLAFNSGTNNVIQANTISSGYTVLGAVLISGFSANTLNNKFLYTQVIPYPSGLGSVALNNSTTATTTNITGTTASNINAFSIGTSPTSGGTLGTTVNAGAEIAEIMVFGRPLTAGEQTQVQNYLKDKWRYDEWTAGVPTPTPTTTPTNTPTPSATPSAPLVFSIVSSASTKNDACSGSTSTTIYADDLGLCGPCAGLTCFACLITTQNIYANAGRTILAADGWYKNEMAPGNFGILQISSGKIVGGTFNNPPCP